MNHDLRIGFAELEPPPGGAERFRRRLENQADRSASGLVPMTGVGLAGLVLTIAAVGLLQQPENTHVAAPGVFEAQEFDRLLGRSVAPGSFSVSINNEPVSYIETPSLNPSVRIYQIQRDQIQPGAAAPSP
jgi:hypothetical protein